MRLSNIPAKISAIFAASGNKNTIPLTVAGVANPNNASFDVGFPPITLTPIPSGGLPPFGADFNGLLNTITAVNQWNSAGGIFPYDASFSTAIGGYPKGALLLKATSVGFWQSTVDNNIANPDASGAGWNDLILAQTINATGDATFVNNSTSPSSTNWVRGILTFGFNISLGLSGYIQFPKIFGGFIFQWSSIVTSASVDVPWTFSLPFPTAVYGVTAMVTNNAGSHSIIASGGAINASSAAFGGYISNTGARVAAALYCFAWGV